MSSHRAWKYWQWEELNILSKTVNEKDLGVTMNANMKVSEQCRDLSSCGLGCRLLSWLCWVTGLWQVYRDRIDLGITGGLRLCI